jgi:hypothetical protein
MKEVGEEKPRRSFSSTEPIKGLINYDQFIEKNIGCGMALILFHELPKVDEACAIRLTAAFRFIQKEKMKS